jgi:hypothetical protein
LPQRRKERKEKQKKEKMFIGKSILYGLCAVQGRTNAACAGRAGAAAFAADFSFFLGGI